MKWDFDHKDISWPGGQLMYDLWRSKTKNEQLPSRQDFHPRELVETLPSVMLVDCGPSPDDFVVRLVGTDISTMMGRDPTHMKVNDLRGGHELLERFQAATQRAAPYLATNLKTPFESKHFPSYSVLVLPLASDSGAINMLMMSLHFDRFVGDVFTQPN